MAGISLNHNEALAFGILGNIISCMVYLSPLPTFYRVYRKKSTEGFQCIPYLVALFSAMLWIYYALEKKNSYLLITINSFGCVIETLYIAMYLIYAPKKAKMYTLKLFLALDVAAFGLILVLTILLATHTSRVQILGWICMCFSVSVFVAPLSIIRLVIRTKSVEFMPFWLSLFLTLSAVVWFAYGLATKDTFVELPNVLGFFFGVLQMLLYIAYKDRKKTISIVEIIQPGEHIITVAGSEVHPIDAKKPQSPPTSPDDDQEGKLKQEDEQAEDDQKDKLEGIIGINGRDIDQQVGPKDLTINISNIV